jgi:hypothetical protein
MSTSHPMTRQEALDELVRYGIAGAQVYLIDFIPLIEMLWADGKVQIGEIVLLAEYVKRHIAHLNQAAGYEVVSLEQAQAFVAQQLEKRPDPELLRTLRAFITPIRLTSSDEGANNALRGSILAACLDIAASCVTEYPFQAHERFSLEEKLCFFEILESLD